MKLITIPVDDIVHSHLSEAEEVPEETPDKDFWLKSIMMSYRNNLDIRFARFFTGLMFPLISNARLPMDRSIASDDAEIDLRKQFDSHNYRKSFTNFPKLIKVPNPDAGQMVPDQGGKMWEQPKELWVPDKVVAPKQLNLNVDRFSFNLETSTVTFCEGLLEDMVKDPARKPDEKLFKDLDFRGVWYVRYIRMLKRAQEVNPQEVTKKK